MKILIAGNPDYGLAKLHKIYAQNIRKYKICKWTHGNFDPKYPTNKGN